MFMEIFYGQWQIDHKIDVALAEKNLLAYLSNAGLGYQSKTMSLRAKFKVSQLTDFGSYDGGKTPNLKVTLNAVYSSDKASEDNQFSMATPSGELWMMVSNPNAEGFFKPGKSYYLDIQEVPEQ